MHHPARTQIKHKGCRICLCKWNLGIYCSVWRYKKGSVVGYCSSTVLLDFIAVVANRCSSRPQVYFAASAEMKSIYNLKGPMCIIYMVLWAEHGRNGVKYSRIYFDLRRKHNDPYFQVIIQPENKDHCVFFYILGRGGWGGQYLVDCNLQSHH